MPCFHVQERDDERLADALQREDALREKVALPERRSVLLDELVPGAFAAFGARVIPGVFQDSLHGVSRDRADSEFFEFAENAGVAPLILFRQLQDDLADLFRGATAAAFHRCFLPALLIRPNPSQQRVGGHNSRKLPQHLPTQLQRESHQPILFLRRNRDAFWQLAAEDFVLDLQVFHLAGQLFLGRAGDHQQQGLKNVRH